eukprot:GHUV01013995.1.p1 GENE.GHUV01013995.1~~GHUV01013995.1.p1  ORF type:complete len:172 (+),score=39.93 GHUV01013995.1:1063-1578(+)
MSPSGSGYHHHWCVPIAHARLQSVTTHLPSSCRPGGIRQQFKAAAPLVESVLKQLKAKAGLQGPLGVEIWDQGDAVGAWTGDKLAAVLFPTADTIKKLQQLVDKQQELLLIVNPQWELQVPGGGVVLMHLHHRPMSSSAPSSGKGRPLPSLSIAATSYHTLHSIHQPDPSD